MTKFFLNSTNQQKLSHSLSTNKFPMMKYVKLSLIRYFSLNEWTLNIWSFMIIKVRENKTNWETLDVSLGYVKQWESTIRDYIFDFEKKNQSSSSSSLPTLHFQSLLDSTQTLTRVAQNLCEQVQLGQLNSDSIQIDTVDRCYSSKKQTFVFLLFLNFSFLICRINRSRWNSFGDHYRSD